MSDILEKLETIIGQNDRIERMLKKVVNEEEREITRAELAKEYCCSPKTISNYVQKGMPSRKADGNNSKITFLKSECDAWRKNTGW